MPWFPDFVGALELARRQVRAAGRVDPVGQYVAALTDGNVRGLETVWPGEVVVHDPRAGTVRGHRQLRRFVHQSRARLAVREARIERVAAVSGRGRAVVELLVHLAGHGPEVDWPVAVVAESTDDRSAVFRTYCSQWPVDGRRHLRPPILRPCVSRVGDVVGRYQSALQAGDVDATVGAFTVNGYYRGPLGPAAAHRGTRELRSFFTACFGAAGGIGLEHCAVTDDGVRCALEYNCVRWGGRDVVPQAGICVHERGADGLLAAVSVYDDVEPPTGVTPDRTALGAAHDAS
jgi:SnoaL-like domain